MNPFRAVWQRTQGYVHDDDPLVEESNWVALTIGTHLPLWPLYIWWAAGRQAWPSSLWTVTMAPVFCLIPLVSRRSGLAGRISMVLAGIANTVLTRWAIGPYCGTELFFVPCAVLAALSFRRSERFLMVFFTSLPLAVWYIWRDFAGAGLHHYDHDSAQSILTLNVISVSVLITAFGWLEADVYKKMEKK
jgi:hypothetical protein